MKLPNPVGLLILNIPLNKLRECDVFSRQSRPAYSFVYYPNQFAG